MVIRISSTSLIFTMVFLRMSTARDGSRLGVIPINNNDYIFSVACRETLGQESFENRSLIRLF